MPRDANGTYTPPAGNPVVSGTVISTTWANPTVGDLGEALSDSLSRTGNGGMQDPLKNVAGSAANPAYTFTDNVTSGMYFNVANNELRLSVNGVDGILMSSTAVTIPTLAGVDAETLGGLTSDQFLRSDADDTATGHITHLRANATSLTTKANTSTTNAITDLWLTAGTRYILRPYPLGVADPFKHFGYDFPNARWFFDASPYVGANAVLDDGDLGVTVQGYDVNTAKLNVAQTFTAFQTINRPREQYNIFGGTILSSVSGTLLNINLAGNITYTDGMSSGDSLTLAINDGASYTATWPAGIRWVGGVAPTLSTTLRTVVELWKMDTTLYGLHSGDA